MATFKSNHQSKMIVPGGHDESDAVRTRRTSLGVLMDRFKGKHKPSTTDQNTTKLSLDSHPTGQLSNSNSKINRSKDKMLFLSKHDQFHRKSQNGVSSLAQMDNRSTTNECGKSPDVDRARHYSTPLAPFVAPIMVAEHATSNHQVSPEEFLSMLNRERANSDSKDLRQSATKAAAAARIKKLSDTEGLDKSLIDQFKSDSRQYEVTRPYRKISSTIIPEDTIVHDDISDLPTRITPRLVPPSERRRRISAVIAPPSAAFQRVEQKSERFRRYSAPVRPPGLAVICQGRRQLNIYEAMNNFPKSHISTNEADRSATAFNPPGHVILWRDKGITDRLYYIPEHLNDGEVLELDGSNNSLMAKLSRLNRCYDLMPQTSSLVILSSNLKVVSALDGLTCHRLRAAPLWSSQSGCFEGMLTITDFIKVLLKYHETSGNIEEIRNHKISMWREQLQNGRRQLVTIDSDSSIYDAIWLLQHEKVHRILVVDSSCDVPLYLLTYRRILEFLSQFIHRISFPPSSIFRKTILEQKVGSYGKLHTVDLKMTLKEALDVLVEKRISSVPVLNSKGQVISLYSKAHVINLAVQESFKDLNMTIGQALYYDSVCYSFEGVYACKTTETLSEVISRMCNSKVHRLLILNELQQLIGIVSVSDIVKYLVLQQDENVKEVEESHRNEFSSELNDLLSDDF